MVIDASVAFKLIVEEQDSDKAISLIVDGEVVAPGLIHAELANALWTRVQKGELIDDGEMEGRLADARRYIRTMDEAVVMPRALRLALELRRPVYDCVYLALAESLDDELRTADVRFVRAVAGTAFAERVKELGG